MFDYINNIRSHHTVPCTAEILHTVMRSTIVGQTCAEIADCHEKMMRGEMSREDFETKKTELKKRLPAFCFHAHFKNGRRLNADAIASGLSILDIDHIKGSPEVFFNEKVKDRAKELGIVLAHKTPSGEGLRLVFVIPQGKGLVEAQQWLSKQIGLEAFDEACKDLARCSFAVPEEYVLFIDEENLFKDVRAQGDNNGTQGDNNGTHGDNVGAGFIPALTPQGKTNTPQDGNITNRDVRAGINPAPTSASGFTNVPSASGAPNVPSASGFPNVPSATIPTVVNDGLAKPLFVFDLCREQAGLKEVDINARGSRHNSLLAILSVGAARLLSEAEAMAVGSDGCPSSSGSPTAASSSMTSTPNITMTRRSCQPPCNASTHAPNNSPNSLRRRKIRKTMKRMSQPKSHPLTLRTARQPFLPFPV